jgi:hypothetical protein
MASKTAAIKVARSETSMHRQGDGWTLLQYDRERDAWMFLSHTSDYYVARYYKRIAIARRALELLGWSEDRARDDVHVLDDAGSGGGVEEIVSRALKFWHG